MTRHLLTIAALAWLVSLGPAASAEPPPGRAPATFFIIEGQVGYGLGEIFAEAPDGLATRLTMGAGGKLVGFPTRFYGIVSLALNRYSGAIVDRVHNAHTSRRWFSWSAGLRTLTPIAPRLRLLGEATLGQVSIASSADLYDGRERYDTVDDSFLIGLAAGLQYRINLRLSVGAVVDLAIPVALEGYDLLAAIAGADGSASGSINPSFLFSLTYHL